MVNEKIVYPDMSGAEPNPDMPEQIKTIFFEAQAVAGKSPRAACALLRLCVEALADHLGAKKNSRLSDKIRILCQDDPITESLLEACRLAGNKAVHDLSIQLSGDDLDLVLALSGFINMVVDRKISALMKAEKIKERFRNKNP